MHGQGSEHLQEAMLYIHIYIYILSDGDILFSYSFSLDRVNTESTHGNSATIFAPTNPEVT